MSSFQTEYDRIFSEATERLASCGLDAAKEYVFAIQDQDYRDATLAKLAIVLTTQNRPEGMTLIDKIENPMERADALIAVAREYGKKLQTTEAREALRRAVSSAESTTNSSWEIPTIMFQAAIELHQLSFASEALSLLRRAIPLAEAGGDHDSAKTLSACVFLLAKWGYKEEANSVIERIVQPGLKAMTYDRIQKLL